MVRAEVELRLVKIMLPTEQGDILQRGRTTEGNSNAVMVLDEAPLGASPMRPAKRAPSAIADKHLPPH
ncbi:MAG: hypothetical protein H7Z43_03360 [Clostridia bacterium]|nr:hypothetical protein [Deltaproteobacteria bacterium]